MQIKHMYLQQLVARRVLTITKIATEVNTSDFGTECLDRARFDMLRRKVGISNDGETMSINAVAPYCARHEGGSGFVEMASVFRLCYAGLGALLGMPSLRGATK